MGDKSRPIQLKSLPLTPPAGVLFLGDPLTDIWGTVPQFSAICLAPLQEEHHIPVYQFHILKIQRNLWASFHLDLQLLQVLGLDSAAQSEDQAFPSELLSNFSTIFASLLVQLTEPWCKGDVNSNRLKMHRFSPVGNAAANWRIPP